MNFATQIFAVIAGIFHLLIFAMESLTFRSPKVQRRFLVEADHAEAVRLWAFNQGFYNLFLGLGALGGTLAARAGNAAAGKAVVLFACGCMVGAAAVLWASSPRMFRGAFLQGWAPLLACISALF